MTSMILPTDLSLKVASYLPLKEGYRFFFMHEWAFSKTGGEAVSLACVASVEKIAAFFNAWIQEHPSQLEDIRNAAHWDQGLKTLFFSKVIAAAHPLTPFPIETLRVLVTQNDINSLAWIATKLKIGELVLLSQTALKTNSLPAVQKLIPPLLENSSDKPCVRSTIVGNATLCNVDILLFLNKQGLPLHTSSSPYTYLRREELEIIKILYTPNEEDPFSNQRAMLETAVRLQNFQAIKYLIETHHVSPNTLIENSSTTPLHEFSRPLNLMNVDQQLEVIQYLLSQGASPLQSNENHKRPSDLATDEKVKALLLKAESDFFYGRLIKIICVTALILGTLHLAPKLKTMISNLWSGRGLSGQR